MISRPPGCQKELARRSLMIPPSRIKNWDSAFSADVSRLEASCCFSAQAIHHSNITSPINGINFPISDQLVPISAHYSFPSTKWVRMFLGRSFEKRFFDEPCWAQGAFHKAAFTNQILMATSWQQGPASPSTLSWQLLLVPRRLSPQPLRTWVASVRHTSQLFNREGCRTESWTQIPSRT